MLVRRVTFRRGKGTWYAKWMPEDNSILSYIVPRRGGCGHLGGVQVDDRVC